MQLALELVDIVKAFGARAVLDRLSLRVPAGEYVAILGPSGSGKSTLLRIVAGFEAPDGGGLRVDGRSVLGLPAHERGLGFVFQSFALFPHLSVADNVAFGLRHRHHGAVRDAAEIRRRVPRALELVGLQGLGGRLPAEISGGQRQRVAFARTLIAEPRIVLLDEPLGALDARLRESMMAELRRIHALLGATFLHVTGNEAEALAMGTQVAVLSRGRVGQLAAPDALVAAPASGEVARLLNCYNVLAGRVAGGAFDGSGIRVPANGARDGAASYCVRVDQVGVAEQDPPAGAVRVPGRFLASEYSGARQTSLFDLGGPKPFEVEYHLGHRRPPEFRRDGVYALHWPAEAARVFAES